MPARAVSLDTITLVIGGIGAAASVCAAAAAEVLRRRRKRQAGERATAELVESLRAEVETLRLHAAESARLLQQLPESLKQLVNIRLPAHEVPNAAVRQVNVAVRQVKALLDPDLVAVFFRDPTGALKLHGGWGLPEGLRPDAGGRGGLVVPLPEGKVGLAEQMRALKSVAGLHIELAAPILSQDELLGVVAIGGSRQSAAYQRWLVALVAELTAVAIIAARARRDVRLETGTDPLTGLYNRRYLMEQFATELGRAEAYGSPLSVILFDIDHFKQFNDRNGHPAGDACLKAVAKILNDVTRGSDFVARYGGEEFILVTVDSDRDRAVGHAERIRAAVQGADIPGAKDQPYGYLSVSAGVASYPEDGETIDELIAAADAALYESKRKGRNRVTAARGRRHAGGAAPRAAAPARRHLSGDAGCEAAPGRRPAR
jgi:diguanylate cyclase (GGDEF)-like protein